VRRWVVVAATAALVVAVAGGGAVLAMRGCATAATPEATPLALADLRSAFNAAAGTTRVVALLSPT
jgi:hypothetical protein